jgi:hypothetical protein
MMANEAELVRSDCEDRFATERHGCTAQAVSHRWPTISDVFGTMDLAAVWAFDAVDGLTGVGGPPGWLLWDAWRR